MFFSTDASSITIPLSFEAHAIAQTCHEQLTHAGWANTEKPKQVYLNSLAIYAVDYYLRLLDFETDWVNSDSRNPAMLQLMDIADLEIKQIGKLECRPVLLDAEVCKIPPEVWDDRLGYVIVELNPSLKAASLLGFSAIAQSELVVDQLEPIESLITTLSTLEQSASNPPTAIINLRNWLDGFIEAGWEKVENLIPAQPELAFGFRNRANLGFGKTLDWGRTDVGSPLTHPPLTLVITLPTAPPETTVFPPSEMSIVAQVHPIHQPYLPTGVELTVSDTLGVQFSTQSRAADNFIQLKITAEPGELFKVTVAYGGAEIIHEFST